MPATILQRTKAMTTLINAANAARQAFADTEYSDDLWDAVSLPDLVRMGKSISDDLKREPDLATLGLGDVMTGERQNLGGPLYELARARAITWGTTAALDDLDVVSVQELAACSADEVRATKGIGPKRFRELETALADYGLSFRVGAG